MTQPFGNTRGPNSTWCVDFKGYFRTRDGKKCYPLTIMDAFSRFDEFVVHYNSERPHEALGGQTPDDLYVASPRRPVELETFDYPADCEVRRVRTNGFARLTNLRKIHLGKALAGQWVGFRWLSDVKWEVLYGPLTIGIFDLRRTKMIGRQYRKHGRKPIHANLWPVSAMSSVQTVNDLSV